MYRFRFWYRQTEVSGAEAVLEQLRACRRHAMRGRNKRAHKLLREVLQWQTRSSAMFPRESYTPLMYTLGKLGEVKSVFGVYWAMQAGGHAPGRRENNIVIHVLAINGELELAERFWRTRQAESVDTALAWSSIIRGAARSRNCGYEAVKGLARRMMEAGCAISASVVDTFVMVLLRERRREKAWDLFVRAKDANCPSIEAFSRLLYAFGKARDKRKVVDMVEMILAGEFEADKKAFTIAYTCLARLRLRFWIPDVYRAMTTSPIAMDGRAWNAALVALASAAAPDMCMDVVQEIRARGYRVQRSGWHAVISASGILRRTDLVMEAYAEYCKQPECFYDDDLWSTVVRAAAMSGDVPLVCNLFAQRKEQLARHGVNSRAAAPSFNGLLMAMANSGYPGEALLRNILEFAENDGDPNHSTYNIALSGLLRDRSVNWQAVDWLLNIADDKEYCYNRLLEWHLHHGNQREARTLTSKMAEEGIRRLSRASLRYAAHLRKRRPHLPRPPDENPAEIGGEPQFPEQVTTRTLQVPEREIEDAPEVPGQAAGTAAG